MPSNYLQVTLRHEGRSLRQCVIEPGEYVVGRADDCAIPLIDEQASQRHARLVFRDHQLSVEDLGSTNGTYVDGQRVEAAVTVHAHQRIQLGATTLIVRPLEQPAPGVLPYDHCPIERQHVCAALDKYEVGGEVARGGMGAVLRATDQNIGRTVAMKVALPELEGSDQLLPRFEQEARVTGQLEHPNIVPVHELGVDPFGRVFYTMKFVQGVTLHDVLEKIKAGDEAILERYSLAHLLTIFQKVCDALAFAHSRGVVHRDLKPANIMIGEYGEVLVMDWGLAKLIEDRGSKIEDGKIQSSILHSPSSDLTLSGQVMGTPQFMATEQAEGKVEEIDARADIFSLGAILYNILTLRPPVSGDSTADMLQKVRSGQIDPPTVYDPRNAKSRARAGTNGSAEPAASLPLRHCPEGRIPVSLSAVAMKALALRQEDRYQTVKELQQDIESYQGGFATAAEHAGTWKLLTLLIKRRKVEFVLTTSAVLLIAVLATGFMVKITRTLAELRGMAPSLYLESQGLVREHRLDDALQRISQAIALVPGDAGYHCLKGNILQALLRLDEAGSAYAEALRLKKDYPLAKANLELCRKLLRERGGESILSPAGLHELHAALIEQGRLAEAATLLQRMKTDPSLLIATAKEALKQMGLKAEEIDGKRLQVDASGMLQIDLSKTAVEDLSPLRGLLISKLDVTTTRVADLAPLRGLPLDHLTLATTHVRDLEPLRGMTLKRLYLNSAPVTDVSPLEGMPLRNLGLAGTQVVDLEALRGMPLQELDLFTTPVSDLSPLQGMRTLAKLNLSGTKVTDLTPLSQSSLTYLHLSETAVSDLSPLKGRPLLHLYLYRCDNITDLSPIRGCINLEVLVLPRQPLDIDFLRQLPKLRFLSYEYSPFLSWDRFQSAADFWKEYDAKMQKTPES